MVRLLLQTKHVLLSLGSIDPIMHQDLNLMALSDVKFLFAVLVHPCISRAGLEEIFD